MTRAAPISASEAARLGWARVDPKPWRKLNARWAHRDGWRLEHCGHPTALHPWALYEPGGAMVCTGVRAGNPPTYGTAWDDLASAMRWVAGARARDTGEEGRR